MKLPVTPTGIVMGCRLDLERRAELHGSAAPLKITKTFAVPEEIDPREKLRVENQQRMGSCSGQAMSSNGEYLQVVATGEKIHLSAMYSYLAGQTMDGLLGNDSGATITGSVRGAREMGLCLETTFPYPDQYTPRIPEAARTEGPEHPIRRHVICRSHEDCFTWLSSGVGGIIIGIMWTEELAENKSGVIQSARGAVYGGHALAVVGYSRRKDSKGRNYLWMLNSHGESWGRNGWAEVAPALFDQWGKDRGAEMIGVTDLQVFTPRRVSMRGMSG